MKKSRPSQRQCAALSPFLDGFEATHPSTLCLTTHGACNRKTLADIVSGFMAGAFVATISPVYRRGVRCDYTLWRIACRHLREQSIYSNWVVRHRKSDVTWQRFCVAWAVYVQSVRHKMAVTTIS